MNPSRLATPDRAPAESVAPTVGDLLRAAAAHSRAATHGLRFLDRRESATLVAWREVAARAERVAAALRALGVAPGERVALIFPTGIEFFDAFFGALLARAVPSPLYPPFRLGSMAEYDRRTAAMITASSASLLLVDRGVRRLLGGLIARLESRREPRLGCRTLAELDASPRPAGGGGRSGVPAASGPAANGPAVERPAAQGLALGSAGDLALVQFSSGTTGAPKPVALSHAAILHQGRLLHGQWPDTPELEQSGVSWLPLYHDMGLIGCILPALMRPATLTLLGPELFIARPAAWLRAISRYRATISPAPNFAYALAAERVRDSELVGVDLSSWRAALNGAEAVSGPALRRFGKRFARFGLRPEALTPVYGLAEAALAVTFSPLERAYRSAWFDRGRLAEAVASPRVRSGREDGAAPPADLVEVVSVGVPVPGFEVEIRATPPRGARAQGDEAAALDDGSPRAEALPVGRVGRIFVRGPSLMNGYLDQPEESAAVLDELGWLDTGDRGFVLDGELWVTGRAKDVLVVHGRNHDPEPLERAVGAVAGVRTGCVVAASHLPAGGEVEELVVLAELRRGSGSGEQDRAAIETAGRQRALAETGLRVDRLVLLEAGALPRTSSGKLRRREALDRYLRAELRAQGDRGAIARLVRRWSERPAVLAALAVARSRIARSGGDESEMPAAELEER